MPLKSIITARPATSLVAICGDRPQSHERPVGSFNARGFTLVELMIVAAIIAVLVSLVMVMTGPLVDSARRISCASNLRQWGIAVMSIAADNRGRLPEMAIAAGGSSPISLQKPRNGMCLSNALVEEYIGFKGDGGVARLAPLFRCPSNPATMDLTIWTWYSWFSMSYSYFGGCDKLNNATVIGGENLPGSHLNATNLLMQDGLFKWSGGPDSWSFNHAVDRRASANSTANCWKGLPQVSGIPLPANGVNQLWGDGRVAWRSFDGALRSDVGNTSLWGAVIGFGVDYYYFPRISMP